MSINEDQSGYSSLRDLDDINGEPRTSQPDHDEARIVFAQRAVACFCVIMGLAFIVVAIYAACRVGKQ